MNMDNYTITRETYSFPSWKEKYKNKKMNLLRLIHSYDWKQIFKKYKDKLEKIESKLIAEKSNIFPPPDLVFNAFNQLDIDRVKIVIIGQDPYKNKYEAMGLSFSVPYGVEIPSSLQNIYKNLNEYKHFSYMPKHGLLTSWSVQGCFLLNATLTLRERESNSHKDYWSDFTDCIIKELNKRDKLIFVLWGGFALKKLRFLDQKRHKIIISSHPSGLSYYKPMGLYPAFKDVDHFGLINQYLEEWNQDKIIWQLPEDMHQDNL